MDSPFLYTVELCWPSGAWPCFSSQHVSQRWSALASHPAPVLSPAHGWWVLCFAIPGLGDTDGRICISVQTISLMLETFHMRGPAGSQEIRSLGSFQGQQATAVLISFPRKVQQVPSHPSPRLQPLAKCPWWSPDRHRNRDSVPLLAPLLSAAP